MIKYSFKLFPIKPCSLLQVPQLLSQSLCLSSSCFLGLGLRGRWREHGPEGPRSENGTDEGAYPVHVQLLPGVVQIVNIRPTKGLYMVVRRNQLTGNHVKNQKTRISMLFQVSINLTDHIRLYILVY